tara:strand:+ start:3083 stop:3307 length:225 start_codon:yes stop_codon:yes gene_type:complete
MKKYGNIEIGDVRYSDLSGALTFTTLVDADTINIMRDIMHNEEASPEEVAAELRTLLKAAILMNYSRGGMRRKF